MPRPKFPNLIHVVEEQSDEPFFRILEDGALDTSIDETTPCALYKLVSEGDVQVERRFAEKAARGRKGAK